MVPGRLSWFFMVPGWFFHGSRLVFHGFYGSRLFFDGKYPVLNCPFSYLGTKLSVCLFGAKLSKLSVFTIWCQIARRQNCTAGKLSGANLFGANLSGAKLSVAKVSYHTQECYKTKLIEELRC